MNDFDSIIKRITVTRLEPGDYTGEDGILYCGKCRTPKQFRMEAPPMKGRLLPHPCRCEQERLDREAAEQEARRHRQAVADLKHRGLYRPDDERLEVCQRQWQMPADETRPVLCRELAGHFSGENFRRATAQDKLARLKNLMD